MSKVIKSGVMIEGVEVTSEHVGKNLRIISGYGSYFYKEDTYPIDDVFSGYVYVLDKDKDSVEYYGEGHCDNNTGSIVFGWEKAVKTVSIDASSITSRKKLAKQVQTDLKALLASIDDAEKVGMNLDLTNIKEGIKMTFQPPLEEY